MVQGEAGHDEVEPRRGAGVGGQPIPHSATKPEEAEIRKRFVAVGVADQAGGTVTVTVTVAVAVVTKEFCSSPMVLLLRGVVVPCRVGVDQGGGRVSGRRG